MWHVDDCANLPGNNEVSANSDCSNSSANAKFPNVPIDPQVHTFRKVLNSQMLHESIFMFIGCSSFEMWHENESLGCVYTFVA